MEIPTKEESCIIGNFLKQPDPSLRSGLLLEADSDTLDPSLRFGMTVVPLCQIPSPYPFYIHPVPTGDGA